MRHAIRIFYLGGNYHGFQLQNDLDTIEKRLQDALYNAGYLEKDQPFLYASRTDKGVDAFQISRENVYGCEFLKKNNGNVSKSVLEL